MTFTNILFLFFLFHKTLLVSPVIYSCNHAAECGCSTKNAIVNKIVGGEAAVRSSWEWAISLQYLNEHRCGGVIISPSYIITAAHCVLNTAEIRRYATVVAGIDTLSESTSSKAQIRSIASVTLHSKYDDTSKTNDIAVLKLDRPLIISNKSNTARMCFPRVVSTNSRNNFPVDLSSLVAIGWGKLTSSVESIPKNLHIQQVTLKAMSAFHSMCSYTINNKALQFCAAVTGGGKGKKKMLE